MKKCRIPSESESVTSLADDDDDVMCNVAGPPHSAPPLMAMQVRRPQSQSASVTMVNRQPQPPPQQLQQPTPRPHLSLVRCFLCFNNKTRSCHCERADHTAVSGMAVQGADGGYSRDVQILEVQLLHTVFLIYSFSR